MEIWENTWIPPKYVKFFLEIDYGTQYNFCIEHFDERSTEF
jgi:hypothetical protein